MIGLSQDGVSGGEIDKAVKGCSALRSPDKGYAFLEEIQEGASDIREAGNEGVMISKDSQSRPHFFDRFQNSGPFSDASNFARINAEDLPSSRRPRYSTRVCSKAHFWGLRKKDSRSRRSRTSCTICRWRAGSFGVAIRMSSM